MDDFNELSSKNLNVIMRSKLHKVHLHWCLEVNNILTLK